MEEGKPVPRGQPSEPSAPDRLDSWKEIAAYLNREVRTVQRWEKKENLPVHRHVHDKLGSVYAFQYELDLWRIERRAVVEQEEDAEPHEPPAGEGQVSAPAKTTPEAILPAVSSKFPLAGAFLLLGGVLLLILGVAYLIRPRVSTRDGSPQGKIKLIVLPFRNLSGDPAQDILARGLTEEMTTQLGRLHPDRLGVIASTTAAQMSDKSLDDIAAQLGVDYVLEGSLRRGGDRVRIDAQLIDASDQTHRWADSYERDLRDILALESDVARSIASNIDVTLTTQEHARLAGTRPIDPEAYEAYQWGRFYWNKRTPEGLQRSVEYFQEATRKDPQYALAYAGLADTYVLMGQIPYDVLPPREAMPKAKTAAAKALSLDDSLAEAHTSLAQALQSYDWDWQGAEKEYKRAIELNPSYATAHQWYSLLLRAVGRIQEAQEQIKQAEELDRLSPVIRQTSAEAFYFDREYARAAEECQKALRIDPNFFPAQYYLGQTYLIEGKYPEAIALFVQARAHSGDVPLILMALGRAYAYAGEKAKARKILEQLRELSGHRYIPSFYSAAIYNGLGDKDQTFQWLDKAYQERTDRLIYLNIEPAADPLRSDPRFQKLLRRIGLLP